MRRFLAWCTEMVLMVGAAIGIVGGIMMVGKGNAITEIFALLMVGEGLLCLVGYAVLARLAAINTTLRGTRIEAKNRDRLDEAASRHYKRGTFGDVAIP